MSKQPASSLGMGTVGLPGENESDRRGPEWRVGGTATVSPAGRSPLMVRTYSSVRQEVNPGSRPQTLTCATAPNELKAESEAG
jgi:hypothetical protein